MLTKFHSKKNNKLCNWLVFHQPLHILPNNNRVELIKLFTFHFKTIFLIISILLIQVLGFNYKNGPNYSIVHGFQEE